MKLKAARYWETSAPNSKWWVALYWKYDPDECPHDWDLLLDRKEWKKMGGGRIGKHETITVDLVVQPCPPKKSELPHLRRATTTRNK